MTPHPVRVGRSVCLSQFSKRVGSYTCMLPLEQLLIVGFIHIGGNFHRWQSIAGVVHPWLYPLLASSNVGVILNLRRRCLYFVNFSFRESCSPSSTASSTTRSRRPSSEQSGKPFQRVRGPFQLTPRPPYLPQPAQIEK